jgi:hypothetical protein
VAAFEEVTVLAEFEEAADLEEPTTLAGAADDTDDTDDLDDTDDTDETGDLDDTDETDDADEWVTWFLLGTERFRPTASMSGNRIPLALASWLTGRLYLRERSHSVSPR